MPVDLVVVGIDVDVFPFPDARVSGQNRHTFADSAHYRPFHPGGELRPSK
jgi:hypothetical protein